MSKAITVRRGSDGDTGRLFGHYDPTGVFIFDSLAGQLP